MSNAVDNALGAWCEKKKYIKLQINSIIPEWKMHSTNRNPRRNYIFYRYIVSIPLMLMNLGTEDLYEQNYFLNYVSLTLSKTKNKFLVLMDKKVYILLQMIMHFCFFFSIYLFVNCLNNIFKHTRTNTLTWA